MKKFSKNGVLLLVGALAVCAFAMPSMASAASWSGASTHDTFTTNNLGFTTNGGVVNWACNSSTFTTTRDNAMTLTVTAGSFSGCTAGGVIGDCILTARPTGLPWIATAATTTDVRINGVVIDMTFTGALCGAVQTFTLTGNLGGGSWGGNAAGQRRVLFQHDGGLTSHANGAATPTFWTGFFAGSTTTLLD